MQSLDFAAGEYLFGLAALIPAVILFFYFERLRNIRLSMVSSGVDLKRANHLRILLPTLVCALIITGLARPYLGYEKIVSRGFARDIMIMLDISRSMLARDVSPSRLEFAKRKLQDLLDVSARGKTKDRIGIVLFSGESFLYCPLTEDYAVVRHFVRSISSDLISAQGTSISEALQAAIRSLSEVKSKNPLVILITDAEDSGLNVTQVADLAENNLISLNVLAVGSEQGSPIPDGRGGFIRDQSGNTVISRMDVGAGKRLAEESGGIFAQASLTDNDLKQLLNRGKEQSQQSLSEKEINVYNEKGYLMAIAALLLVVLPLMFRKEAIVICLTAISLFPLPRPLAADEKPVPLQDRQPMSLYQAYKAYENGQYKEALETFKHYQKSDPDNLKVLQALGSAYYKLGDYKAATEAFTSLSDKAKDGTTKYAAEFNLGNSFFQLSDFKQAISRYDEALRIKPGDGDAVHNRELALKALKEQKPTPTPTPNPSPDADKSEDKDKEKNQQQQEQDKQQDQQQNNQKEQTQSEDQQDSTSDGKKDEQNQADKEKREEKPNDPAEERQTQNADKDPEEEGQDPARPLEQDEGKLAEAEAKAWLESLPETPLLLRRKTTQSRPRSKQTW